MAQRGEIAPSGEEMVLIHSLFFEGGGENSYNYFPPRFRGIDGMFEVNVLKPKPLEVLKNIFSQKPDKFDAK